MLALIKLALRITTDKLDTEITLLINTARAEMVRAGVPSDVADSEDNLLITQAIKTYCMYQLTDDTNIQEKYLESWTYQLDNIRKHNWSDEEEGE